MLRCNYSVRKKEEVYRWPFGRDGLLRVFDETKWLRWFSIFDIAAVEERSKLVYYHLPTSIEFPIAEYDKATKKSQLFCCLEYALRHEIKKRNWVVTLEIYPEFTGATIIAGISSQPREIAFKRNKEKNHTVKALCMAFFEAIDSTISKD